jgi:DNA-binding NtrC family response regulator
VGVGEQNERDGRAARVLVIDVDDDVRAALCEVLSDAGYRTTCVPGLDAAQQKLAGDDPPSLVLMCWDVAPSPREKVALLDALPEGTTAVLMSTHPKVAEVAKTLGVPFVEKPFELDDLLAVVERASQPPPSRKR